jgi:hypothetical protein
MKVFIISVEFLKNYHYKTNKYYFWKTGIKNELGTSNFPHYTISNSCVYHQYMIQLISLIIHTIKPTNALMLILYIIFTHYLS